MSTDSLKIDLFAHDVDPIDLFVQPYCRIPNLVDSGIAKRQTASVYLKQLADIGMLSEQKVGREKLFLHGAFLRLLTRDDNVVPPYAAPAKGRHTGRD